MEEIIMKKLKIVICILLAGFLSGCFYQNPHSNSEQQKPSSYYISYINSMVSDSLGNSYKINKAIKEENFIYLYGYFIFKDFKSLENMALITQNSDNVELNIEQTKSLNLISNNVDEFNYEGDFILAFNDDCIDYTTTDTLSFNLCISQKGYVETYLYVNISEIENFTKGV